MGLDAIGGASFAVLVAEEMFASGCHLLLRVTLLRRFTLQIAAKLR